MSTDQAKPAEVAVVVPEWYHLSAMEALRAEVAARDARIAELERGDRILRTLLAYRTCPMLYRDDGELSDCSAHPFIDFKRDTAEAIQDKLQQRSLAKWKEQSEPTEHPSAIPVGGSLAHPDDAARAGAAIGDGFEPMR